MFVLAKFGPDADRARLVEFLVDTGTFYTVVPQRLADEVGVEARLSSSVTVGDSRQVETRLGLAYLAIDGRSAGVPIAIMDVPMPLMGVAALEVLGFKVDPIERRLEPTRPFGPAVLVNQ